MLESKEKIIETLKSIREAIENEHVSYGEIHFLETHKQDVLDFGDIVLAQWANISEEEWNEGELRSDRELFNVAEDILSKTVTKDYSNKIALALFKGIKEDVYENADIHFTESDVKLAIGRALMDKFNLWDADFDKLELYIED